MRQCTYSGLINELSARAVLRHIDEDLDDGTLLHQPLKWTESLRQAEIIASRRAMKMPCRSLDLWHIAAAIEIGVRDFVTFDRDQLDVAQAEGLNGTVPQ